MKTFLMYTTLVFFALSGLQGQTTFNGTQILGEGFQQISGQRITATGTIITVDRGNGTIVTIDNATAVDKNGNAPSIFPNMDVADVFYKANDCNDLETIAGHPNIAEMLIFFIEGNSAYMGVWMVESGGDLSDPNERIYVGFTGSDFTQSGYVMNNIQIILFNGGSFSNIERTMDENGNINVTLDFSSIVTYELHRRAQIQLNAIGANLEVEQFPVDLVSSFGTDPNFIDQEQNNHSPIEVSSITEINGIRYGVFALPRDPKPNIGGIAAGDVLVYRESGGVWDFTSKVSLFDYLDGAGGFPTEVAPILGLNFGKMIDSREATNGNLIVTLSVPGNFADRANVYTLEIDVSTPVLAVVGYESTYLNPTYEAGFETLYFINGDGVNPDSIAFDVSGTNTVEVVPTTYNIINTPELTIPELNCVVLPVELVTFTANVCQNKVCLYWETVSETNNRGFEIQYSINGYDWSQIGFLEGHGTTTQQHSYRYIHENILEGVLYYRLLQIDYDDTRTFSDVRIVEVENRHTAFQVFPNPTFGIITIINGEGRVELYDAFGQLLDIYNKQDDILEIDISSYPEGVYFLLEESGASTKIFKW